MSKLVFSGVNRTVGQTSETTSGVASFDFGGDVVNFFNNFSALDSIYRLF